jgi:hypothetical protein
MSSAGLSTGLILSCAPNALRLATPFGCGPPGWTPGLCPFTFATCSPSTPFRGFRLGFRRAGATWLSVGAGSISTETPDSGRLEETSDCRDRGPRLRLLGCNGTSPVAAGLPPASPVLLSPTSTPPVFSLPFPAFAFPFLSHGRRGLLLRLPVTSLGPFPTSVGCEGTIGDPLLTVQLNGMVVLEWIL